MSLFKPLSAFDQRRRHRFHMAIQWMVQRHGYEKCGVLSLTFAENLADWEEAEKRFASFEKNVLSKYCRDWMMVVERQGRGAIHYHLVVGLCEDIRTGTDIARIRNRRLPRWYRYAKDAVNPNLRRYWQDICARASGRGKWKGGGYGMGRVELMPFYGEVPAVANYFSKYMAKGLADGQDKRKKKVRFSRSISTWLGSEFQANTYGHWLWRKKLELVARDFGLDNYEGLYDLFGPRWFYVLRDCIRSCPYSSSKEEWKRGIAERVFRAVGIEHFDRGGSSSEWVNYRAEKGRVWERIEKDLRAQREEKGDPDWSVPYWDTPTEVQLQLLLMNYENG